MRASRSPDTAWLGGFAAVAALVATALRIRHAEFASTPVWLYLLALQAAVVLAPLLRARATEGRCAFAAGAAAGVLVGIALAQRTPTAWIQADVAWHCAKVAVAAAGHPFDDPIIRSPTVYPFLFSALAAIPVALGVPLRATMWAVTPISLAAALWAFWWMARAFLRPLPAAWAAVALPLVFYFPQAGFALLPNPFNLSLVLVFGGLGLLARGALSARRGQLASAGLALGVAGLLWYAHLVWITAAVLLWSWKRWRALVPVALGALAPALVLALHVLVLGRAGNLGSAAITADAPERPAHRLGGMARNLMTLSGDAELGVAPAWIGPLVVGLLLLALLRRTEGVDRPRVLRPACAALAGSLLWAGLALTFWDAFSWRYAFLLYALVLVVVAGARPWTVAGREVGPIVLAAVAASAVAPMWILRCVDRSLDIEQKYESTRRGVAEFLERSTAFDEPVFAQTPTWEEAIACTVPRPTLVDRHGGTYKYAPAAKVAGRWRDAKTLERLDDPAAIADILRPYGFRYALISQKDRALQGYETLATSFAVVLENADYRIVDLTRPGGRPWESR